jgi:hypothetical protein
MNNAEVGRCSDKTSAPASQASSPPARITTSPNLQRKPLSDGPETVGELGAAARGSAKLGDAFARRIQ